MGGDSAEHVPELKTGLPVVISDTDAVYLYGLDILAQQQSERLYYMHDGLGSVRQQVDTTGQIETSYAYDPFGVPVAGGDVSNPYQYTGEAWDADVELLYLRARYYQPDTGRFVTRDPWMGDTQQPGTLNGYVYVRNSPVNLVDPSGLQCVGPRCPQPARTPTTGPEPEDVLQPTPPPISATDVQQDTIDCDIGTGPSIRWSGATPTPTVARIPEGQISAVGNEGLVLLHQRTVVSGERIMSFILLFPSKVEAGERTAGSWLPAIGQVKA